MPTCFFQHMKYFFQLFSAWSYFFTLLCHTFHSWQRGANPPPILPTPPFSNFVHTPLPPPPPPHQLPTSTPTVLSVVLFIWLIGWSRHIWCAILINANMDLHVWGIGNIVPEGRWCVFYTTRRQVHWGLTYNVFFYWYYDLISHTQTHEQSQHTHGRVDWHHHVDKYLHHLLCGHSIYLYYIKWLNE